MANRKQIATVYQDLLRLNQSTMLVNNQVISTLRSNNLKPELISDCYSTLLDEYKNVILYF